MKDREYSLAESLEEPVTELAFSAYDVGSLLVTPLIVQTEYLTLKELFQKDSVRFLRVRIP